MANMPSHLTRRVYRRLLAGNGLLLPCLASPARPFSQFRPRLPTHEFLRGAPRRTFFAELFQKPPREVKEPELEPGYDVLLDFRSLETEKARLPDREPLINGLERFIGFKRRRHQAINPTQAFLLIRVLTHLLVTARSEGETCDDVSTRWLRELLFVLRWPPRGRTDEHLALAKLLYDEIEWRQQAVPESLGDVSPAVLNSFVKHFLEILTRYGASVEAVERFDGLRQGLSGQALDETGKQVWAMILEGLAREGLERELLSEYQKAREGGLKHLPGIHEIMTTFYSRQDKVEETKSWFERPIYGGKLPTPETYLEMVRFSLRNGQQQWSQPIFENLLKLHPQKEFWDVLFQWAVLAMDRGVEDIKKMISTMQRGSGDGRGPDPDFATIDALITAAIEKNNPYLAERFLSLGAELRIPLNSTTYLLQMNYRIDARDFSGAEAIWEKLRTRQIQIEREEDVPVINKYLRLLCSVDKPNLELILDITAELEQRRALLEPETVVALCMTFLHGDQQFDVIDTLSVHTLNLSLEERAQVRKGFVEYCLDRRTSTARIWDAYSLLRQYFPETEPQDRIRLMDAFFDRRRPDMACYVFGHMRGHGNPAQRPTVDTYARCLEGLGKYPDRESLRMVHNMLKMDTTVEVGTRLRNALMLAYASCGEPFTALEFWEQIAASSEGPTYNSLAILFYTCECLHARDNTAQETWNKIKRMDLEIPPFVFWSYCGALAGQGLLGEAQRLISGMEASLGYSPSLMT